VAKMILDCSVFSTELDILEGRLEYLNDIADYFIIVESDTTFSGEKRELVFPKNLSRYKRFIHKIIYMPWTPLLVLKNLGYKPEKTDTTSDHWALEKELRDSLMRGVCLFRNQDYVLISDMDEIPTKGAIRYGVRFLRDNNTIPYLTFQQGFYYYNFNQKHEQDWHGTMLGSVADIKRSSPTSIRDLRDVVPFIYNGGVHLSYWMTPEQISEKVKAFAHQELNKEPYTNVEYIGKCISEGKNIFSPDVPLVPSSSEEVDSEIRNIFNKYIV
jgi:beta-1,4-mannosyl-glycoprotein beta-1,4-N-acetylglucosaminyltransferase